MSTRSYACAALFLTTCVAACGGSHHSQQSFTGKPTDYSAVSACLGGATGQNYAGMPPNADRVVPQFAYRSATGGWLQVRASTGRYAVILFYRDEQTAQAVARQLGGGRGRVTMAGPTLLVRSGSLGAAVNQRFVRCFRA